MWPRSKSATQAVRGVFHPEISGPSPFRSYGNISQIVGEQKTKDAMNNNSGHIVIGMLNPGCLDFEDALLQVRFRKS